MKIQTTDILILHGKSLTLVDQLKSIFKSMGISAGTVLDQPSGRHTQRPRVESRIRTCKLALVLATFDEDVPNARTPRSNVIHELTLCSEIRPKDTIVLVETRNGIAVDVGSNLSGHLMSIPFDDGKVYQAYAQMLNELRDRELFSPMLFDVERTKGNTRSESKFLIQFMKDMDALWKKYDLAWKRIPWGDYNTLRRYADNVDHFFVCYWKAFDVFAQNKNPELGLKAFANTQYEAALQFLEPIWRDIAHAYMDRISKRMNAKKSRVSGPMMEIFQKEEQKLSGTRKDANIESRVKAYLEIGEALYELMQKLETSR